MKSQPISGLLVGSLPGGFKSEKNIFIFEILNASNWGNVNEMCQLTSTTETAGRQSGIQKAALP